MEDSIISVQGLRKSYGNFEAVKGLDFEVRRGEIFGLLGPNGAGKSTTLEIMETLKGSSRSSAFNCKPRVIIPT
jgi:ABC-2 type transport system ATP-binding protein